MAGEQTLRIRGFTGINTKDHPSVIPEDKLVVCQNFDVNRSGELVKRTGFVRMHNGSTLGANQVMMLGHFRTPTVSQLVCRAGSNLYVSTDGGTTWTIIGGGPWGNVEYGVQYAEKFYMVRYDNTIVQWDGTTATALAGTPSGTFCKVWKDRLFVLNSKHATLASRLFYSDINAFNTFGGASFIDVRQGDGDFLVSMASIQDTLIVFKARSTWGLYVQGVPVNWQLRSIDSSFGCIAKNTAVLVQNAIFFLTHVGVYATNGIEAYNVSDDISDKFKGLIVTPTNVNLCSAGYWNHKYILCLETTPIVPTWNSHSTQLWDEFGTSTWQGTGGIEQCLIFHEEVPGWSTWMLENMSAGTYVPLVIDPSMGLYSGSRNAIGEVYKYGPEVYDDNGAAYECSFTTKEYDFGSPDLSKRGKWALFEQIGAGDQMITNIVNRNSGAPVTVTGVAGKSAYKIPGPGFFRTWQFNAKANHRNPLSVFGLTLHMHLKAKVSNAV